MKERGDDVSTCSDWIFESSVNTLAPLSVCNYMKLLHVIIAMLQYHHSYADNVFVV